MIRKDDIFLVEGTDQMVLEAVHYAEKSLHYTFNRMGKSNPYDRVRNIVKGLIMEAAFKRLLDHHNVQYNLLGNTHWTKKDRYDVGIDGHRYDIKGFFVGEPSKVNAIKNDKGWLLDCSALVPSDQLNAKSLKEGDFYIFPFMVGDIDRNQGPDLFDSIKHKYRIHAFWDYAWFKNERWESMGKMTIQSQMEDIIRLRIGGQDVNKDSIEEEYVIHPGETIQTKNEFFTVLFLQTTDTLSGELIIHCLEKNKTEEVDLADWGNIWVYDSQVYITGLMSKGEFKRRSREIPRFYKDCKQYSETRTVNNMLMIADLDPITPILPSNSIHDLPVKEVKEKQVVSL